MARKAALQEVGIMTEDVRPTGTYRTLDEQREVLTPAEERFEKARQTIGLFLGPIVFLILYLVPLPLEQNQQTLVAILSFTIIYWLSEAIPIPVTAVVALGLCVVLNVPGVGPNAEDSPGDIVFGAFSDDTIFLFIGAFIIAQAMVTHGLDKRFAFRILSLPGVARSDRKSTRLNSSHANISYAVFCLKKKKNYPRSSFTSSVPTTNTFYQTM